MMEYTPLNQFNYKLYPSRWYILILFSFLSANQSNLWITYGAVAETAEQMYNTSSDNINFLAAAGTIGFIPLSFFTSWAIGEYGIRTSAVTGAALCAAGAALRCFAKDSSFWMVIVAQFLNAAAGPVVMNTPPALSTTWFGVHERTFATAVGTMANSFGSAFAFLIGLAVQNVDQLHKLLYFEAMFTAILFVLFLIYFPDHPPSPPSATSSVKREKRPFVKSIAETMRGTIDVLKSKDGFLILAAAGLASGANGGWGAMLVSILGDYYSQWDIQWLGFFNIIAGVIGGVLVGKVHDHYRHFKVILCSFFLFGCLVFVTFSLATQRVIVCTFMQMMSINVAAGFALGAIFPVSYEALVEVTYPIKEEVSAGTLSLGNNLACLTLLIVGDYWAGNYMNYAMAGICLVCFFMVLLTKETYIRTTIDLVK